MPRKTATQIPSKGVVRVVACILFAISAVLMYVAVTNIGGLGWFALVVFLGGLSTSGFALASIVTGSPEWILLDLIIPG